MAPATAGPRKTMSMKWLLTAALLFVPLGVAAAEDNPATKQRARAFYDEGEELYAAGKYREAQAKFARAYETLPLKAFLFNIAQCHFQLEEYDSAGEYYRAYLKDNEDAPNYGIVQEFILEADSRAEAQRAQRDAEKAQQDAAAAAAAAEKEQAKAKAAQNAARLAEEDRRRAEEEAEAQRSSLTGQWWFWPSIGIGLAAAAVAVVGAAAGGTTAGVLAYSDSLASQGSLGYVDGRTGSTP